MQFGLMVCGDCGGIGPRSHHMQKRCISCRVPAHAAAQRTWFAANRRSQRDRQLKRDYDLTREQYDEMLAAQGGVCAICKKPETTLNHGKVVQELAVDHDHVTGRNRALLCATCNYVRVARYEAALLDTEVRDYLERYAS